MIFISSVVIISWQRQQLQSRSFNILVNCVEINLISNPLLIQRFVCLNLCACFHSPLSPSVFFPCQANVQVGSLSPLFMIVSLSYMEVRKLVWNSPYVCKKYWFSANLFLFFNFLPCMQEEMVKVMYVQLQPSVAVVLSSYHCLNQDIASEGVGDIIPILPLKYCPPMGQMMLP